MYDDEFRIRPREEGGPEYLDHSLAKVPRTMAELRVMATAETEFKANYLEMEQMLESAVGQRYKLNGPTVERFCKSYLTEGDDTWVEMFEKGMELDGAIRLSGMVAMASGARTELAVKQLFLPRKKR